MDGADLIDLFRGLYAMDVEEDALLQATEDVEPTQTVAWPWRQS